MITDRQEMFSTAWKGLKAQGFVRSITTGPDEQEMCLYRGSEGRKCAFGHCISDEEMEDNFEGDTASGVLYLMGIPDTDGLYVFADRLQNCHDQGRTPGSMETHLTLFAREYNLEIPA